MRRDHDLCSEEGPVVSDGIQWLIGRDDWSYSVIFARGIAPEELALRILETRFGLALPRDVEERQLRAFVIR
jgi:hypothetical protein